ncbi:hypothetical protein [Agaribacter flavus]|uniref:Periplasmic protein n=1 Tax=Agaribacter flavus TaxID=1902781 RepID=A0ABV7FQG2_9ALTE
MKNTRFVLALGILIFSTNSFAETNATLDKLKAKLLSLEGRSPISAIYERQFTDVEDADDDKKRRETTGSISVKVQVNDRGLHINYPQDIIETMEEEAKAKALDEESKTPTLNAVYDVNAVNLDYQLSAAKRILRRIEKASFIEEETATHEGKQVSILRFNLPLEAIITDAKTRRYVSKFEGVYSVTVDENAIPLKVETDFFGKGRAFLVLSVKVKNIETSTFTVVADRLVRLQNEYSNEIQSSFGDNQSSGVNSITIVSQSDYEAEQQIN